MTSDPVFLGRKIVVTGAAAGIGLATLRAFAGHGATVLAVDRDAEGLARCAGGPDGGRVLTLEASVTTDVERIFEAVDGRLGGIDLLVNNAGIGGAAPAEDMTDEAWDQMLDINLRSVFRMSRAAGRRMIAQGGGQIINVSSIAASRALHRRLHYCVAKAGVSMLTQVLATEWARHGIRVNAVAPGYVATELVKRSAARGTVDLASLERRTPMNRLAEAEEIAGAILLLARPEASYVTGAILPVDGGYTAHGDI